jgi:hypothetical protein
MPQGAGPAARDCGLVEMAILAENVNGLWLRPVKSLPP